MADLEGFNASLATRLRQHLLAAGEVTPHGAKRAVVSAMDTSASGLTVIALRESIAKGWTGAAQRRSMHARVAAVVTRRTRAKPRLITLELGSRSLDELRAELAAQHSPIVGDELHGGQPASRLMLHITHVAFKHPVSGEQLAFEAQVPKDFSEALQGSASTSTHDPLKLPEVIERATHLRWGLWHSRYDVNPTTAFRLLNAAGDGFEGLALDVYDDWLVAHHYGMESSGLAPDVLRHLQGLGFRGIYLKNRPRQANTIVDAEAAGLAPSVPVWGEPAAEWLQVLEHGIPFWVRLADGLATGLYLDQRQTRQRVRMIAGNKSVLNLFAYTCAFGVAAGLGNAALVVNVDISKRALAWGRRNLTLAGAALDRQRFIQDDVFKVMSKYRRQGRRFDVVILDPPTYACTHRSRFSVAKDYPKLLHAALSLVASKGTLIACCNFGGMSLAGLRRHIQEAAHVLEIVNYRVRECPSGLDFPGTWGQGPQLKALEVQLE